MPIKILIVEDEPLIAEDLASILTKEGYQIIGQAYDGITALDFIHNRRPDIVLLDIALDHRMSGLDVAKSIRKNSGISFVFITSFSDKQTLQEAKNLLPEGYIVKPFKKKDILATLEIVSHRVEVKRKHTLYLTPEELNRLLPDPVTPKEYELLVDLAEGLNNDQLSQKHFISLNTVKTHLKRIFQKLEISSRSQAVTKILQNAQKGLG